MYRPVQLAHCLLKHRTEVPSQFLLVGDGGVGKSSLVDRLHRVDTVLLDSWSSQGSSQAIDGIIRAGQAFILVYSVVERHSFEDTVNYCKKIRQVTQDSRAICALVGNKRDLSHEREVFSSEGRALARELDCDFFETSAKTGENLELVVQTLVQRLRSTQKQTEIGQDSSA
ncbi:putative ras-related protein Rap-2c [Lyophyllum shimeji]|uniref:small monomeric GTPase n=1 Tax=Lyophyllum shimeji TaxID=47721 RepID=A0A9P3US58_LYOSH|nr:putative ras-related protein Rap-2c [Lyophyllum shimeji]